MGARPHSAPLSLFLLRLGIRAGYERGRPAGGRELSRRKLLTAAVAVDRERESRGHGFSAQPEEGKATPLLRWLGLTTGYRDDSSFFRVFF